MPQNFHFVSLETYMARNEHFYKESLLSNDSRWAFL